MKTPVGRTPWSAADALVGLLLKSTKPRKAGPGGPARTRGSALGSALGSAPLGVFNGAFRQVSWKRSLAVAVRKEVPFSLIFSR
jgi:hypothetical protein